MSDTPARAANYDPAAIAAILDDFEGLTPEEIAADTLFWMHATTRWQAWAETLLPSPEGTRRGDDGQREALSAVFAALTKKRDTLERALADTDACLQEQRQERDAAGLSAASAQAHAKALTLRIAELEGENAALQALLDDANAARGAATPNLAERLLHALESGFYVCRECQGTPVGGHKMDCRTGQRAPQLAAMRKATHRCKICGSLWHLNPPDPLAPPGHPLASETWSWLGAPFPPGPCCDNVPMGDQIERVG